MIAAMIIWWVLHTLVAAWWLHEGRDRYPFSPAAVERIQARADRKQQREALRNAMWQEKTSV